MKKFIYTAIFLAAFLSLYSCSEWLNLLPEDDLVSDEYWKTQEDVEAVLASTYGTLTTQAKTMLLWGELRGGLFSEGQQVPSDASKIMRRNIDATNSYTSWSGMYKVINGANQIIRFAPDVVASDPSFTGTELRNIMAEAYFLRSLAYFYLVRVFGEVPLILEPYTSDGQDYYPEKSDVNTLLNQITDDLKLIEEWAPADYDSDDETRGRVTSAAVNALLCDVCLYTDKFDDALIYANKVIGSGRYALLSSDNWFRNFYPGNSNSSILELQFGKAYGYTSGLFETFSYSKQKQFIINFRAASLFTDDDVRGIGASIGEGNSEVWKYVGINQEEERTDALNDNNFILYRLADIYLMKAEALAEQENYTDALNLINEIRSRRGVADAIIEPSVSAFQVFLLEERAREFAGEGKYWFDLVRIGKRNNYAQKQIVIQSLILNAPASEAPALALKFNDPDSWYLPINDKELQINTNLKQNPYYQ